MKVKLREKINQSDNWVMANHLRDKNALPETTHAICNGESRGNQAWNKVATHKGRENVTKLKRQENEKTNKELREELEIRYTEENIGEKQRTSKNK